MALTSAAEQYDYEAELASVIGRRCRSVGEAEALDHVFGYCNANDLSARDLQIRTSQWLLGKSPDGFLPVGPELVTADEAGDPQAPGDLLVTGTPQGVIMAWSRRTGCARATRSWSRSRASGV